MLGPLLCCWRCRRGLLSVVRGALELLELLMAVQGALELLELEEMLTWMVLRSGLLSMLPLRLQASLE